MERVLSLISAILKGLLKSPVPHRNALEQWESVVFHVKNLTITANDLVAGEHALVLAKKCASWKKANLHILWWNPVVESIC